MRATTDADVPSSPGSTGLGAASHAKRHAAAAMLLRESARGVEVLLVRRLKSMAMAGGEWVFPGGALEAMDHSARVLQSCAPLDPAHEEELRAESSSSVAQEPLEAASCVAACREVFEETGILLARDRNGTPCRPELVEALQPYRVQEAADPESFVRMLEAHHLVLELDRLVYWARWITPSVVPRRFDTRFFIAPVPAGQRAQQQLLEADESRWLSLLDDSDLSSLTPPITAPPTLFSLRDLAALHKRQGSLQGLLMTCRAQRPPTIMMKLVRSEKNWVGLAPWDAEYPGAPGEGVPCDAHLRARFATYPSRLVLPIDRGPTARI